MEYTKIPTDTFSQIQLNAGILCKSFVPSTGTVTELFGATTGGVQFQDNVTYNDFGEDIDNCPKNTKELKKLESHEVTLSGTFVTITPDMARRLAGPADISGSDSTKIIPRNDVLQSDFEDMWWVGDYSDKNTGANAGFVAIHLLNGLNTGGFQIQSTDRGKGQFAFTFTGHYSMDAQDVVPFEVYVKSGATDTNPRIELNTHYIELTVDDTVELSASVRPSGSTITWSSASTSVATISNGVVTAEGAGNTIITASITSNGVTVNDTCTVVVTAGA